MEDIQEYLQVKLREFNKRYNVENQLNMYFDREIKRRWKRDHQRASNQWQYIKSVSDVQRYINGFIGTVKQYQNIRGVFTDSYDMDLALYKAILSIRKMTQCYDFDGFDFSTYGKKEVDEMFDVLYEWLDKMNNVNIRRAMQD